MGLRHWFWFACGHNDGADYRAYRESKEVANLKITSDQGDCQHHCPNAITTRNPYANSAKRCQTNRQN